MQEVPESISLLLVELGYDPTEVKLSGMRRSQLQLTLGEESIPAVGELQWLARSEMDAEDQRMIRHFPEFGDQEVDLIIDSVENVRSTTYHDPVIIEVEVTRFLFSGLDGA